MAHELRLVRWPFHNGRLDVGMGRGAAVLAGDTPFREEIEAAGWRLTDDATEPVDESTPEIARVTELIRRLAGQVRTIASTGAFPLVLAGNCNSCLGTVAGIEGDEDLGVVWFDAHADLDDPEENTSGFFDVMALAMLTGRGWRALRETIPGHRPVAERDVVLAGVRDLEPYQRRRLESSAIRAVPGAIEPAAFERALADLSSRVSRVYLHVDLDALDASVARVNAYAAGGGPRLDRLTHCIRAVCRRFQVAAAAITAYDPECDVGGAGLVAARRIAGEIATGVRHGRSG